MVHGGVVSPGLDGGDTHRHGPPASRATEAFNDCVEWQVHCLWLAQAKIAGPFQMRLVALLTGDRNREAGAGNVDDCQKFGHFRGRKLCGEASPLVHSVESECAAGTTRTSRPCFVGDCRRCDAGQPGNENTMLEHSTVPQRWSCCHSDSAILSPRIKMSSGRTIKVANEPFRSRSIVSSTGAKRDHLSALPVLRGALQRSPH